MWELTQNEELCSLVSDDLRVLTAISEEHAGELSEFQRQRLTWYERGRFPCGYLGNFPNGKWVIV